MFSLRRDNRSTSERVLVPADDPATNDSGVDEAINEGAATGISYADVVEFVRRRKCMFAFVSTGILILSAIIVATICATAGSSSPVIYPTTPSPTTTTTTTPSTTTTTSTTPPTTTTSTTTHKPSPPKPVPTLHPLPPHPETLAPKTLLMQIGLILNFTEVPCYPWQPPTFRYILTIDGISKNYTGESDKKKNAETAACMLAANDLFGISYNYTEPAAKHPCFKNATSDADV